MTSLAYENALIHFALELPSDAQAIPISALDIDTITETILNSPWNGNQPLRDCLKPGQQYDWGFNLDTNQWLSWEFTLKPGLAKKDCQRVLKQAIRECIEAKQGA